MNDTPSHQCPLCTTADPDALIERVAEQLWESRRVNATDTAWAGAGDYWHKRFRELAETAIRSLRE